ncbi:MULTISPECIES: type II toxin-antitoxin system RelE/ParE family toxin [Caballeronia]|uniref:type II toxin-antitoxin system RelE/ParE family toxin n=1 Tax=Caballeronia TaxID=1827195 RepID=UPI0002388E14|nr:MULTISPECIES: type II toxin-antitoxin system RelE/ParE family toxin [unclassified Caballeronia]AET88549.1 hypothetical protein BYI23_A007110 [Burkholderia sp. YI23]MCE4542509.1 type II toxin-antitoxin system RelE/ParE family toxin [Caballeronia sp. PC1]MCE4568436.1 type II toxin-antitoxin system RelE/ParE family toxin [Caballeronia sp. CLC5]BAO85761.1 putative uncharacterized protein [Burkholderia sp. RPE67]
MNDERKRFSVRIMGCFDTRLTDIERHYDRTGRLQAFDLLVESLHDRALPLLRRFPAIGRRVLNTNPDTVHALQAYEQVVEATVVASSAPELREYIFDDYVLLYLLTDDTIYLVSIRHSKEVSFDFEYLWGAER